MKLWNIFLYLFGKIDSYYWFRLSTLGNSTRVYDHLKQTSIGLKSALSSKYSGYLSRDGMTGLAPESEDCDEAMEACLTLRDVYEPPSMGFDSDEEGYFEDNSD